MAKSAKNCLHFCSFYPFFSQVLHTPPLIFRKHRLFRGARKRGFRAPKTPPGGIPGGRKGGFQNIGVSGGGLPLKGLCFGKGGCGAPDPPKGGSGGSGGGGGTPLKGVPPGPPDPIDMAPIQSLQNGRLPRPEVLSLRGGYSDVNLMLRKLSRFSQKIMGPPQPPCNCSFRSVK